jgi:hypothetical protein
VLPFAGRAVIGLVCLLGLAVLDLGSRASAGLTLSVTQPRMDAAWDTGSSGMGAARSIDADDLDHVWPPKPHAERPVEWAHPGLDGPSSGGAGSSSGPSSGPGSSSPLAAGGIGLPPPALVARLRARGPFLAAQLCLSAIFEPPRAAV